MKATQPQAPPMEVKTVDGGRGKRGVSRELFEKTNEKPAKAARAAERQARQGTQDRDRHPGVMGGTPRSRGKGDQA